jgi:hypothetical protein
MKQINFKFKGKQVYVRSVFLGDWGFCVDFKLALRKPIYKAHKDNKYMYGRFLFWYFDKQPYSDRY